MEAFGKKGSVTGVVATAEDEDPAVKVRYRAQWSRFTAAHEYGQMIGLIEEYKGASSAVTVKEMISAGWLRDLATSSSDRPCHSRRARGIRWLSRCRGRPFRARLRCPRAPPAVRRDREPRSNQMRSSGIGAVVFGAFLVAVGAILAWAVTYEADGIDLNQVGVILFITGVSVGLIGLVVALVGSSRRTVRTVHSEPTHVVESRPVASRRNVVVEE